MVDHQDYCPSLEENPLMSETSMANLPRMKLEQHKEFHTHRTCLCYFHADFVNHPRERNSMVSLGLYCISFVSYGRRKVTPWSCSIHHYDQLTSSLTRIRCNF